MAFNPDLPVANSEILSAELRDQFNGLKELVDARPTNDDVLGAIRVRCAANVDDVPPLELAISDPPTQSQVQAIYDQLEYLRTMLQRPH